MNPHLHVSYLGLVRNVIGRNQEDLDVLAGTTVCQLLGLLIEEHGQRTMAVVSGLKGSESSQSFGTQRLAM